MDLQDPCGDCSLYSQYCFLYSFVTFNNVQGVNRKGWVICHLAVGEMNGGVAKTLNSVLCNYVRLSSSKMQRLVELLQDEAKTPQSFKGTLFSSSPVWKLKLCYEYSFPTQKWLNVKKLFFNRYGINLRLCQIEF